MHLKLLIQELQAMNIQLRIITDKNIDHLSNLSFENTISNIENPKIKKVEKQK